KWVKSTAGEIVSSPSVANGHVLFGSKDRNMYMLKVSDGTVEWQQLMSGEIEASPAIAGTQGFWVTIDGSLHSWGGAKPARADLAIVDVTPPNPFYAGQTGSIRVTVKNQGTVAAASSIARIYIGSQLLPEAQVAALEPNKTAAFTVAYAPPSAGTFQMKVVLDADKTVMEGDEGNN